MSYTKAAIEQARRRQEMVAAVKGEAAPLRGVDGIKTMQVDPVLFHQARILNQRPEAEGGFGVQNCWAEPEFCSDMKKRHPEIAVRTVGRRTVVGGAARRAPGVGRLIRPLGRVTFHKRYG